MICLHCAEFSGLLLRHSETNVTIWSYPHRRTSFVKSMTTCCLSGTEILLSISLIFTPACPNFQEESLTLDFNEYVKVCGICETVEIKEDLFHFFTTSYKATGMSIFGHLF